MLTCHSRMKRCRGHLRVMILLLLVLEEIGAGLERDRCPRHHNLQRCPVDLRRDSHLAVTLRCQLHLRDHREREQDLLSVIRSQTYHQRIHRRHQHRHKEHVPDLHYVSLIQTYHQHNHQHNHQLHQYDLRENVLDLLTPGKIIRSRVSGSRSRVSGPRQRI